MQEYPHLYQTAASAKPEGEISVTSPGLNAITISPPPQFGGPEGNWSPETLLVASVANCFILTFRAIAKASKFDWLELECEAQGKLEKLDRVTKFTEFNLKVTLKVPEGSPTDKAERIVAMAEKNCLITNSLTSEIHLHTKVL